ncbi:hypothetical protein [Yoonia litorea]|uniref:Dihydroxy-acid dehydratase n=1 Tax=Yoonia litorea TaxID=1123755 RepID=A0A1I6N2I1_9RHOB|nr:hypothetical protein [Yoonia litorea]SFS22150.1 hypothetical protein SAMN05444714_3163 [Yoonia litorea]
MFHRLIGFLSLTMLTACTLAAPERSTTLADGEIFLQAPAGYCVDMVASRPSRDFAVLAPCNVMGVVTDAPDVVGLVTVQAGAADSGAIALDEIALRDFLITDTGNALLSQTGNAASINVLSTQAFSDQVMVHFADNGPPPVAGLQNEEWRAFRSVGGRLVTVGVRGASAAPLQDGPGASLLKLVLAGVRSTETPDS